MQNSKEEMIINALLTYPTIRESAQILKMPESTIYNYLRKTDFKIKYNQAKSELLLKNAIFLQSKITDATATITDIMNDVDCPPQVRITACRTVLEYALKLTEQAEIIQRIEALEWSQSDNS